MLAAAVQPIDLLSSDFPSFEYKSNAWVQRDFDVKTNCRIKEYFFKKTVQVSSYRIFKDAAWEAMKSEAAAYNKYRNRVDNLEDKIIIEDSIIDYFEGRESDEIIAVDAVRSAYESKRRARSAVVDIAYCQKFDCMFTFTLSPDYIDRYNIDEAYSKLKIFLSNMTRRYGFRYVCVPELHSDGAIHFHGFCNLGDIKLSPAISPKTGLQIRDSERRPVYNMDNWKWGYSTCVYLDRNYEKAVSYVTKYITKSDDKILGKWYLSSRDLQKKPNITLCGIVDYRDFLESYPAAHETICFGNLTILSLDIEKQTDTDIFIDDYILRDISHRLVV